ncbi:aldehyde dehydrogenase family protein [Cupriavidus basilensis]
MGNSRIVLEPVGVVAAITPWNYPLHQITAKLAPALLAGCTVVLKPSELAPATAVRLMDAVERADLPRACAERGAGWRRRLARRW